jgi:23S rRNA pseudouridine955/2504/2580 synthase
METTPPATVEKAKTARRHPVRYVQISRDQAGRRIDNYLAAELRDVPRQRIYQMLRRGEVRVNGRRIKQGYRLEEGEEVRIPPVSEVQERAAPGAPRAYLLDLVRDALVYEDANLLAINKPAGLVVHGGTGRSFGVIELLRILYREEADKLQLVHRLDRETSGVLLVARNMRYLSALQHCFRQGRVGKRYQALLRGRPAHKTMMVDKPLDRNRVRAGERLSGISEDGKDARTTFKLVRIIKEAWLADVDIETGRTHQIRVHASSIGHPVAGDEKYGDKVFNKRMKKAGLKRLFLHAGSIHVPVLEGSKALHINAPLPDELAGFLRAYGQSGNQSARV